VFLKPREIFRRGDFLRASPGLVVSLLPLACASLSRGVFEPRGFLRSTRTPCLCWLSRGVLSATGGYRHCSVVRPRLPSSVIAHCHCQSFKGSFLSSEMLFATAFENWRLSNNLIVHHSKASYHSMVGNIIGILPLNVFRSIQII
jgi:hypothetical protein